MKNINKRISIVLKELRSEKGWSLGKAAEKTGVSKAMLGQIEREESSPTIGTLWKIASGFDASFSTFIEDPQPASNKTIYRRGKAKQLHPEDKKIRVMPIFPINKHLHFEMFIIELLPSCEHISPPHQPGVIEHVIVTEGKMDVLINGIWQQVNKGEGLQFDANQPHGYRNRSTKIATFHNIIHYT